MAHRPSPFVPIQRESNEQPDAIETFVPMLSRPRDPNGWATTPTNKVAFVLVPASRI
jgi:hypothetical protein